MPCCGCSPCGGQGRTGPLTQVLGAKTQNDFADCFKLLFSFLSCKSNENIKRASGVFWKEVELGLEHTLGQKFPEADKNCLAEVVPELVRTAVECIQECDPQDPSKFILCLAQRGTEHIVNLVRCLFGETRAAEIQEGILDIKLRDGMIIVQSLQAGMLECLMQILLPLLCGGLSCPPPNGGGGGGGDPDDFRPSEKERECD